MRGPDRPPRSTCGQRIWPTWGWHASAHLPVVLVGDIDRGGLLAHLFGTVAVLAPEDQALIAGFVVNKFRGDPALLAPGLTQLEQLTGRPTYGVIPFDDGFWLDTEDSVSVQAHRVVGQPQPPVGEQWLKVAAIRLPRISNSTDVEALACEPGVLVRWVTDPADLPDADVVVIPGSKATVADLHWLRDRGLADGIAAHARAGRPVLGICGGFQMLCRHIDDHVESGAGGVDGLGSARRRHRLRSRQDAAPPRRPAARLRDSPRPTRPRSPRTTGSASESGAPRCTARTGTACSTTTRSGAGWLTDVAAAAGRHGFTVADDVDVPARRDAQLDLMADLLAAHVDIDATPRACWTPDRSRVRPSISALRR